MSEIHHSAIGREREAIKISARGLKNMNESSNSSQTVIDYAPNIFLPILFLFFAFLCVIINSTILFKLIFKPKLWTLVNLFLSLLLGENTSLM